MFVHALTISVRLSVLLLTHTVSLRENDPVSYIPLIIHPPTHQIDRMGGGTEAGRQQTGDKPTMNSKRTEGEPIGKAGKQKRGGSKAEKGERDERKESDGEKGEGLQFAVQAWTQSEERRAQAHAINQSNTPVHTLADRQISALLFIVLKTKGGERREARQGGFRLSVCLHFCPFIRLTTARTAPEPPSFHLSLFSQN
mmetsp:Transcript_42700/g.84238  ORF Transcript_42700/g.84238 Transcript_42700/m.84238 type:complete len:198 (-) Transcript_42700:58-651(-)